MNTRIVPIVTLTLLTAAACKTTINVGEVTDTSAEETDTTGDSGSSTTGTTGTTGSTEPTTTDSTDATGKTTTDTDTTDGSTSNPDTTTGKTTTDGSTTDGATTDGTTGGTDTSTTTGMSTTDSTTTTTTTDGSTSTGEMAMLGDWTKYREVLVDNGLAIDLTDYQVLINVSYDADMLPDYADLRFTDESGNELLPYWIEYDTGPVNAYVWVRVPLIAADDITTIRMYYGNPNADPGTNGFDTFLFFDDFEAAQLDAAKWKTTAPVSVNFGRLTITQGAVYSAKTASTFQDTRMEARATFKNEPGAPNSVIMASQGQVSGPGLNHAFRSTITCRLYDGVKNVYDMNCSGGDNDSTRIFGIGAVEGRYYYHTNRAQVPTVVDSNIAYSYYLNLGHVFGKAADLTDTQDIDIDWVLVRRMAKTDPTTFVGGEKNP